MSEMVKLPILTRQKQRSIAAIIGNMVKDFGYQEYPGQTTHTDGDLVNFGMKVLWEICDHLPFDFEMHT